MVNILNLNSGQKSLNFHLVHCLKQFLSSGLDLLEIDIKLVKHKSLFVQEISTDLIHVLNLILDFIDEFFGKLEFSVHFLDDQICGKVLIDKKPEFFRRPRFQLALSFGTCLRRATFASDPCRTMDRLTLGGSHFRQ